MVEILDKIKNKLIVIDWGMVSHRAIFSWRNRKEIPAEYTACAMLISYLRKIGIEPMDEVIIAVDAKNNWRKEIDKEYKANRKEIREKFTDIPWSEMYGRMDALLQKLDDGTSYHIIKIDKLEADDIASVACRYFKDKEIILVSFDSDWEQLILYPNVKVFSPLVKFKGSKGAYKVIKESPYRILAKKIEKEVSDNLVNPILNAEDYERRKMIVSLLELPDFVENVCIERFKNLEEKEEDLQYIPFKTIREKMANLYNDKDKVISYEDCLIYAEKKKKAKKRTKKK